ncbi:Multidrug resistance-associated protein 4 [Acromyrmex echinatior]|uniref:Multidrug resistance-associated protein 4 n=1 Tax=Acromyrmex echinatior TaxID=103372 RepID=F4X3K2_ACREC|nr:Multidrug resistance-associated protein 4 [Acromyrmex echinatior]
MSSRLRNFGDLEHQRLGPADRRRRRVTVGVIIVIIIIIVTRLIGVTRAVELLVSNEGAQVVEADVTGAAVARPTLAAVQIFVDESSRSYFTLLVNGGNVGESGGSSGGCGLFPFSVLPFTCISAGISSGVVAAPMSAGSGVALSSNTHDVVNHCPFRTKDFELLESQNHDCATDRPKNATDERTHIGIGCNTNLIIKPGGEDVRLGETIQPDCVSNQKIGDQILVDFLLMDEVNTRRFSEITPHLQFKSQKSKEESNAENQIDRYISRNGSIVLPEHQKLSDLPAYIANVCALTKDFRQFPQGDMTMVGDRGVSLSGGQRTRINLARAVYRQADIYLLDNPLSAVDIRVVRHLYGKCITEYLYGKTRILITHQLQFLKRADHIHYWIE